MQRRGFLGAMLAAASAPAFVKAESLMGLYVPKTYANGGFISARSFLFAEGRRMWAADAPYRVEEGGEPFPLVRERIARVNEFELATIKSISVGMGIFTMTAFDSKGNEFTTMPIPYEPLRGKFYKFPLINEPAKR